MFDIIDQNNYLHFRLNATEYSDLKEKLHSPIRMARDVVIKQSLSDRFLDAFKKQVDENDVFVKPPDMVRTILI